MGAKRIIREVWRGDHYRLGNATPSGSDLASLVEDTSRLNLFGYLPVFDSHSVGNTLFNECNISR